MTYEILESHSYDSLDAALYCIEIGLQVFPIHGYGVVVEDDNPPEEVALGAPPKAQLWCCTCGNPDCQWAGKHPIGLAWQRQATSDPERARQMDWRNRNIGVLTEGLTVVDVDPRNGGSRAFVEDHGPAATLTVRTGGGGWHYYFRGETKTSPGLVPGIDIKSGPGGYVVGPGSSGYSVLESKYSGSIAAVPGWLSNLINRKGLEPSQEAKQTLAAKSILNKGERDNGLTAVGGLLRRYGFTPEELLEHLKLVNRFRCNPPLNEEDVRRIAESVGRYAAESEIPSASKMADKMMGIRAVLDIKPPEYEVQDIWPEGGVNVLWGPPGVMKSLLALELLLHRSAGVDWHGFKIKRQVKTLYVAAEGMFGMGARAKAIMTEHHLSEEQLTGWFFLYPEAVNILDVDKAEQMRQLLLENRFELVVFDTLRKSMTGGDENNTQDIGRLMSMLENWSLEGINSLLIHHANKSGGHRGSSAIEGDAYNMLGMIRPDKHKPLQTILTPTKFKDAPTDFQLDIKWKEITISANDAKPEDVRISLATESVEKSDPDGDAIARQLAKLAERSEMDERDREIAQLRKQGVPRAEVATRFGIDPSRVSQICREQADGTGSEG